MKKLMMICLSFMLIGCGPRIQPTPESYEPEKPVEDKIGWVGEYVNDDLKLTILYHSYFPDGFEYQIEFIGAGRGIVDNATFSNDSKTEAIYDSRGDGYEIKFTLKGDKVIIKETGGTTELDADLSGTYIRKQVSE